MPTAPTPPTRFQWTLVTAPPPSAAAAALIVSQAPHPTP